MGELGFWFAVALVAVFGVAMFKILGARFGHLIPGLHELAAFL